LIHYRNLLASGLQALFIEGPLLYTLQIHC
jgi:hypothetical protein